MGIRASLGWRGWDGHGGFRRGAVLLVRYGVRPIAKYPFAVLLHRIMAKPELSALRQLRPFSMLLSTKGLLDGEQTLSDMHRQTHVMREACEL